MLFIVVGLVVWQDLSRITALGNVTTALMALTACVLSRPVVVQGRRFITPIWQRIFGHVGRFSVAHLAQQARRASLTVATLALGLEVTLMFGMLGRSFEHTLVSQLSSRFRGDLVVTSAFSSGGWVNAPFHESIVDRSRQAWLFAQATLRWAGFPMVTLFM